jgi:hypothetical protein
MQERQKNLPARAADLLESAEQRHKKTADSLCPAPKGASDFEGLTVSLKRYPDTKPKFFRSLLSG